MFLVFFLFVLSACKQKKEPLVLDQTLPDEFIVFYEKFHSDSLFQINHINFPLEGARKASGNNIKLMIPFKWELTNWLLHKPFDDHNATFERKYFKVGPVIIEKIQDRNNFFAMERRFSKVQGEWYLIYYSVTN